MPSKGPNAIQVCIKLRPREPHQSSLWKVVGRSIQPADGHAEPSVFDHVFDEGASNQEVFDRMAQHIVRACMQGFNGTIFAYGQTSSGKTYTMMGDGQNPGVMVLAAKEIFREIANEPEREFLLRVGYIEIYNEKIYDLLDKKNPLELKISEATNGIVNVNYKEPYVTSEDELLHLLCPGKSEAHTNDRSGRSHAIFRIIIESRKPDSRDHVIQSVLNLVDLAGHERVDPTSPTGPPVTEGFVPINKCLTFLSNVIKNLSENVDNKFVNFRDSKLTRILQPSLSGCGFTSIICTIKPSVMVESQSTLNFATLAKKIRLKPSANKFKYDTRMGTLDCHIKSHKHLMAAEQRKNNLVEVHKLEGKIRDIMLNFVTSATLSKKRRRTSCPSISDAHPEAPKAGNPEHSRLPRLSKPSLMRKPSDISSSLFAHRLNVPPRTAQDPDERVGLGSEANCDALEVEVVAPTASNKAANAKIEAYEEQVKTLKQIIERLEMENREAVNLNQQFENHKAQAKQLETDLLTTITEKDSTIESLQQSLKELSRDVLLNSKEEHMRVVCPDLESSCERICNNCQRLVSLLPVADGKDFEKIASESDQLRSEIAATRAKLESVQSAYSQASGEMIQKTDDCERLQERYDTLDQQNQSHKLAIEHMQAEYQAIQQKYQKLHEEYESLGRTSNASEEQCQQLQADNTRLQVEIGTLKERLEEAQLKLMKAPSLALSQEFKAQNEILKAKLAKMQLHINQIQEEYDSLSNQLMESVQENDALREELKQRPRSSVGLESMKSSGVDSMKSSATEVAEPEHLLQQFAQLSASIRQIELKDPSGSSRLFGAYKSETELDESPKALKLCLESPHHIEAESPKADAYDGINFKGMLIKPMFQFVAPSQEQLEVGEQKRLLNTISQLQKDVELNNSRYKDKEAEVSSLKSKLLEKDVLVTKEYQRQIEQLKKQNDELRIKVLGESTLVAPCESPTKPSEEDALKAFLAGLKTKVCELQAEMESQLKQMQLKDRNIAELKAEIEELSKRCVSSEATLVKAETEAREKQQVLDRHSQKLSDAALLIDQLKERDAKMAESLKQLEARHEQTIGELREALKTAKDDLITKDKLKTDEINALQLEYMDKMEASETENRAKFRAYTLELEDTRGRYEAIVATLKEQHQAEIKELKSLNKTLRDQNNVTAQLEDLQAKCEQQAQDLANLRQDKANLQLQINDANERKKESDLKEKAFTDKIDDLEEALQKAQLKALRHGDLLSEHKQGYDQLAIYTDNLREEKALLQAKIEEADAQHSCTLKKLHELEMELDDMSRQKTTEKSDLPEKLETVTAKISDLEAELQSAKRKACSYDDLISEHEKLKSSLSEATGVSSKLQDKVDSLQSQLLASGQEVSNRDLQINELRSELRHALEAKDTLATQLQALAETMSSKAERFQKEVADLKGSLNELQLKLKSLQELKNALETDNDELKVKLRNSKNLQSQLEEEQKACSSLRAKIVELEEASTRLEEQLRSKEAELKQKCSEMSQKVELGRQSIEELTKECDQLRSDMRTKTMSFQGAKEGLDSTISSLLRDKQLLEEEIKSLKLKGERNAELMAQLNAKEAESESLREALINQKLAAEAADIKCLQMVQKVEELTKESDKLRSDLQTSTMSFQREKESLDSTVSTLLRDKQLLEEEIKSLNLNGERIAELKAQLRAKDAESESLREALINQKLAAEAVDIKCLQMEQEVQLGRYSIGNLTKESDQLRSDLQTKNMSFQREKESLDSTVSTLLRDKQMLEEKIKSLNLNGNELMEQLRAKDAESESLRKASIHQKLASEAANRKCLRMEQKVKEELTKEIEKLRIAAKSKESSILMERVRMNDTIFSLLEDKRNLEEKQCTLNEMVTKLEAEVAVFQDLKVNGSNSSFESNASAAPPTPARTLATSNLDRHAASSNLDRHAAPSGIKKSIMFDSAMRKDRRITAHDERRKSALWDASCNTSQDCATMTDPEGPLSLSEKLQACQQELYIRDSQVIALNMEQRPLKEENEQLKSRLLEEQRMANRLRQKVRDLSATIGNPTDVQTAD